MKHILNKLLVGSLGLIVISACSKFDKINTNPNTTEKVTSGMIATNLLVGTLKDGGSKYFCYHNMVSKHLAWGELLEEYQYNKLDRTSFSIYGTLRNCQKMVESASNEYAPSYEALSKFLKAYNLFYLSLETGDIPYRDALKAEEGDTAPKYDTQKDVMLAVLADLDSAYELFKKSPNFEGDPIYGGKTEKWQKCVNTFQLKVLINLSKRADDADLKIRERFAIVMQRPIFTSNADNYQLVYSDKGGQIYPFNKVNSKHAGYGILTSVLIDPLKELGDYRLFAFAEPAKALSASADSFDAYVGVNPALPFSDVKNAYTSGNYCGLNLRYTTYAPGEPVVRIGYPEMNFIIAEAINRGIYPGDAAKYYSEGIRSAMTFVGANTPDNFNHGRKITPAYIESYISDSKVSLSADSKTQLEQIMLQKYFLCLLNHKWDSYYDYRRTGLPVLPIDPTTNMNQVSTTLPTRWRYPENEYRNNTTHLNEALERQYGGNDENNSTMWILK